jgi:hypothetical protein
MTLILLLAVIISVAVPVSLTWAYTRWLSPLRSYVSFKDIPGSYMLLLAACAIIPLAGASVFNYIERAIDMDTWWWLVFGAAIIMCSICMNAILVMARHKRWLIVIALPYLLIAGFSTAAALLMAALNISGPGRLW